MLKLSVQSSPRLAVLCCSGRIVKGDGPDTLYRAAVSEDKQHVLIDLKDVTAIDAAGLGALVRLERWSNEHKRTLHLVDLSVPVREALEVTGLSSVFQVLPTLSEAVRHVAA